MRESKEGILLRLSLKLILILISRISHCGSRIAAMANNGHRKLQHAAHRCLIICLVSSTVT
jgi:hypothetical protein